MKKTLVLLLAMMLLVSMSGMAVAGGGSWFAKWDRGASVKGDIFKKIVFENKADAETGDADSYGNDSLTTICSTSEAKGDDSGALATNSAVKGVSNTGEATAWSSPATADNQANNGVENNINEQAQATSDTSVCVDVGIGTSCCPGPVPVDGVVTNSVNENGSDGIVGGIADILDCCPATVDGDIAECIEVENEAEAETGDAYASGNYSATFIADDSKALACDGGSACNNSEILVVNDGVATAWSGPANATNNANNYVTIDIFRSATSAKTIDVFAEFLVR